MKKTLFFLTITALLFSITGCGRTENQISIKGSDTELNLVSDFASAYQLKEPSSRISVTGGGSGTGIAALIDKRVDIGNASRLMKSKEIRKAKKRNINIVHLVIATDGVSIIVNPANKVKKINLQQLAAIYKGEIKNWKEVGGTDMSISTYGRQSNSGTYEFVKKRVLKKKDFSLGIKRMNGNSQIVANIKNDKAGIGYVGIGYIVDKDGNFIKGINILKVAENNDSPYLLPNKETVMSSKYPLTRPLNQYLGKKPLKGSKLYNFINFCINSPEALRIIKKNGFFPVQDKYKVVNKKAGF